VPRLIEAKVARVVVGCVDPNPQVAGRGVEQLRQAGIAVDVGVGEAECKQLASLFFARIGLQRPYVTLKWAQTANGKVAGPGGTRLQISNAVSTRAIHRLRAAYDSILVGIRTVLADDPLLTARLVDAIRQPARYVLDRGLLIPLDARLVTDMTALTTVFCAFSREAVYRQKRDAILAHKAGVTNVRIGESGKLDLAEALAKIADDCHRDLLVEAGPTLAQGFFDAGLVDRLWVIRSSMSEPDATAPGAAAIPADYVATAQVDLAGDMLIEYVNPASPVFFAATPSADFLRATGALD
jgi:diaminohydroxyphosphoribosylaminopyrimidine deaminase/5-amino-6-(5-phosphoribosylamino)uracil reductase